MEGLSLNQLSSMPPERPLKKNLITKYIRMCVFCFCCDNKNRHKGPFDPNELLETIIYYMI